MIVGLLRHGNKLNSQISAKRYAILAEPDVNQLELTAGKPRYPAKSGDFPTNGSYFIVPCSGDKAATASACSAARIDASVIHLTWIPVCRYRCDIIAAIRSRYREV